MMDPNEFEGLSGGGEVASQLSQEEALFEEPEEVPATRPVDYTVRMTAEDRAELGRIIADEIDRYYEAVAGRLENCLTWRRDYELMPTGRASRWENSSDVPGEWTRYACDSHHTRLNAQIVQADPPFVAEPLDAQAVEYAPLVEEYMAAKMEEAEWPLAADLAHKDIAQVGNGVVRVTYERETKRVPQVQVDVDERRLEELIQLGLSPFDALHGALQKDAKGRPKTALSFVDKVVYTGSRFKFIPFEDCVLLPATVRDPEKTRGIGERVMISGADLLAGAKDGRYLEAEVRDLVRRPGDAIPDDLLERLDHQGIDGASSSAGDLEQRDGRYREYECFELCWFWDANDDGKDELLWVTLHKETRRILRCQYMPYEHGEPNYVWFDYIPRPGQPFGQGVAELVACLQDAGTAILNQIIDHGDYALNIGGNFVYDDASEFDPDRFILKLGTPIRMKDTRGFVQLQTPILSPEHYNMLQKVKDSVDLVAATSNPSLGKATDTQRTLGEVQLVASNANVIFEVAAARVARKWAKVWEQVRSNEAQFAENGAVSYRKKAQPGQHLETENGTVPAAMGPHGPMAAPGGVAFAEVPVEALLANVRLVPAGLKQLSDMQSRIQQAMLVKNELMQNPLTAGNLEVQKLALRELLVAARWPAADQVMDAVEQQIAAQRAVQQAELAAVASAPAALAPPPTAQPGETQA